MSDRNPIVCGVRLSSARTWRTHRARALLEECARLSDGQCEEVRAALVRAGCARVAGALVEWHVIVGGKVVVR